MAPSSSFLRASAAAFVSLALAGVAAPAAAAEPDEIFQKAMEDLAAGRYDAACPALRRSYRLEKRPRTLFHLAECEEKAGRIATAALHYDEYLDLFERLSPPEQRDEGDREKQAFNRRERLEPDIPRVTFKLPDSAPVGTKVTRVTKANTDPVPVALGIPLPIDPGEHFVMTEPNGGPRWEKRFFVSKGDRLTIDLRVASPEDDPKAVRYSRPLEPVPALMPPPEPGVPAQRIAAYVAGGIGVAGLITGIVTGAVTWSQKGVVESNCRDGLCNVEGEEAADLASVMGTVSTIGFTVGLVGIATSVVLFLTEPEPSRLGAAPGPRVGGGPEPILQVDVVRGREAFAGMRWSW